MPYEDFWGGAGTDPEGGGIEYGGGGGGYEGGSGVQGLGFFGNDPFGYTGGSLLTPWTQKFTAPAGSSGGASGINMNPFSYGDFNFSYSAPGAYGGGKDINAGKWGYSEFQSPEQFVAPTAEDMKQDPSYQIRLKEGQNAMLANAAAKGLARTGGFAKGMADYNQEQASKEYGNVYARKKGEYDTTQGLARQDWDRRFSNAKDINEYNIDQRYKADASNEQNRLGAYTASADANIRGNTLAYQAASGSYDRNRQNAQDAYNSAMQIAQSNASAGASNADESYRRALNEYQMNYDIFNNNQNTQWNRLTQGANMGMGAAGQQGQYGSEYAQNQGNTYGQQANARAGAKVGGANSLYGGIESGANTMLNAYLQKQYMTNGSSGGGGLPWKKSDPGGEYRG